MRWGHVDEVATDVSDAGRRRTVSYSEGPLGAVESQVGTRRSGSSERVSPSGRAGGGRVFDQLAVEAGLPRPGHGQATGRRQLRRRKRKRPGLGVEQVEDAAGLLAETAKSVWRRGR